MNYSMPGFPVLYYLPEFAQTHGHWVVIPSNHLILCHYPSSPALIRVFFSESTLCIRWPKYWSFSFSIGHSSEYSGLISFRIDWFDLLAVQGTLKNQCSQALWSENNNSLVLSPLYGPTLISCMITVNTIALTIHTIVSKVMSLLLICSLGLSWLFFQGESLLISWLQSLCTVILGPNK